MRGKNKTAIDNFTNKEKGVKNLTKEGKERTAKIRAEVHSKEVENLHKKPSARILLV